MVNQNKVGLFFSLAIIFSLFNGVVVYARDSLYNKSTLQVAGGISMPATSSSVFTNPAGLVGASTALELQAAAPKVLENGIYRAGLQTGGSSFGVAAGIEDRASKPNSSLLAYYGAAVGTQSFSLGVAGKTGISSSKGSTFNAGLLFTVVPNAQIGFTARGLDDGVNEWGGGIAFSVTSGVDLVVDAAADNKFNGPQLKPGIKVHSNAAAIALSYGTGVREQFADGFSAAASFQLVSQTSLEFQYNAGGDLSKYFAAVTIGF